MPRWRKIGVDTLPALKAESFRLSLVIHMDRQVERFWQNACRLLFLPCRGIYRGHDVTSDVPH